MSTCKLYGRCVQPVLAKGAQSVPRPTKWLSMLSILGACGGTAGPLLDAIHSRVDLQVTPHLPGCAISHLPLQPVTGS